MNTFFQTETYKDISSSYTVSDYENQHITHIAVIFGVCAKCVFAV